MLGMFWQISAVPATGEAHIGLTCQLVTAEIARAFGLDSPKGALVSAVRPNGPAAVAGIRPADIIPPLPERFEQQRHFVQCDLAARYAYAAQAAARSRTRLFDEKRRNGRLRR